MTTSSRNSNCSIDSCNNLKETLISLPVNDLQSNESEWVGDDVTRSLNKNDSAFPSLLLLQLSNSDIQQFINCKTYILGKQSNASLGGIDSTSSQACLVMEAPPAAGGDENLRSDAHECCGKSFLLNRVETSNSLILIPYKSKEISPQDQHTDKKIRKEGCYAEQVGRLVNPSSFLEVKTKTLNKQQLHDLLYQDCISRQKKKKNLNGGLTMRSSNMASGNGYTVSQLAFRLESSISEVREGLVDLCAFEIESKGDDPRRTSKRFTFLSDEIVQEVMRSIFATLIENPELVTNQGMAITVTRMECITQVLILLQHEDESSLRSDDFEIIDIILYCLNLICISTLALRSFHSSSSDEQPSTIVLDMNKVASYLAHEIFLHNQHLTSAASADGNVLALQSSTIISSHTQCSWNVSEFQKEWNRRMPSISAQLPSLDLLKGIALKIKQPQFFNKKSAGEEADTNQQLDEPIYLLYFPERSLPLDAKQRFEKIFAFREEWTHEELDPYIETLVAKKRSNGSVTQAELLLKYTRVIGKDDGSTVHRLRK